VVGCEPDYFAIKDWPVTSGDFFDATQEREGQSVALLGRNFLFVYKGLNHKPKPSRDDVVLIDVTTDFPGGYL
jgi:hypothetical protein